MLQEKINSLNPMQKKAVLTIDGALLLLAGAGSGKTRVLTHRIAYLIEEMGVNPFNIMAITFTNKAAREMKERVEALTEYGADVLVSTFHSACVRILRRDINRLGYMSGFTIYDAEDAEKLIKSILKTLNIDEKKFPPKSIINTISAQKDVLKSPEKFESEVMGDFYLEKVAQVYKYYQKELKQNNALDFDDIIFNTVKLFVENPDVLLKYQNRFKYIMVDEYQDTSKGQYMFIKLLSGKYKNICVVGDDDQSIYGWRGADITNILNFEKDFENAQVIKLEQNYRSTQNILDAANNVIHHNLQRKNKELWTENNKGDLVFYYRAKRDISEASFIAKEIKKRVSLGASFSDFAILYRNNTLSRIIEEYFVKENVPYRIFGGVNFYGRREIKDVLAYLKLLDNPEDNISLIRIINVPKRGIGPTTIDRIQKYAQKHNMSMFQALGKINEIDGIKSTTKITDFYNMMVKLKEIAEENKVSELIEKILEKTGYKMSLISEGTDEAKERADNINELYNKAVEYEKDKDNVTLSEFLEEVSLVADIDNYDDEAQTVTLMTLHSSKGLEFPVVFIIGFEESIFPGFRAMGDTNEMEEERRLCYVGITRAKKILYLTCARHRMRFGEVVANFPSRFLKEIPNELITTIEDESFIEKKQKSERNMPEKPKYNPHKMYEMPKPKNVDYVFNIGDKVKHLRYGVGKVINVGNAGADYEVTVKFMVGEKKLMAKLSGLKPVE